MCFSGCSIRRYRPHGWTERLHHWPGELQWTQGVLWRTTKPRNADHYHIGWLSWVSSVIVSKSDFFIWRNESYREPLEIANWSFQTENSNLISHVFFNLICTSLTLSLKKYFDIGCVNLLKRKINCIAPCKFKRFSKDKTDFFGTIFKMLSSYLCYFKKSFKNWRRKILFQTKKYPFCYVMRKKYIHWWNKDGIFNIGPCITALRSKLRALQKAERGEGGRDVGKRDRGRAVQGSNGGVTGLCKAHCYHTQPIRQEYQNRM